LNQDYSISASNLSKVYRLYANKIDIVKEAINPFKKSYHKEFFALKNISLNVKRGEILGIIGPNGAGKSTLLKLISGILVPSSGKIIVKGKISALLNPGEGFNPDFTGYENIHLHCIFNGYGKADINNQIKTIEEFADIGEFINQPFRTYSAGMKARLSFAAAVNINPDILIVDEILSVGDELFRRKSYQKMEDFFKSGKTVLFVTHEVETIKALCTNAIFLNRGEIEYKGSAEEAVNYYDHFIQSFNLSKNEMIEKVKSHYSQKTGNSKNPLPENNIIPAITTSASDIRISDFMIITEEKEENKNLKSGKSYQFRFKTYFGSDVNILDYYIAIKDEKGVRISSLRYHLNEFPEPYSWYQVECDFLCRLLKGYYFVDIGIGNGNLDNMNLSIIAIDVMAFKVRENIKVNPAYEFNGYFYMDQVVRVRKMEAHNKT
jgi:ABC-type polysaccharide/polyol phosphate transport system ATPase subunit